MIKIALFVAAVAFAVGPAQAVLDEIPSGQVAPAVKLPKDAPRYLKVLNSETCRKLFAHAKLGFTGTLHVSDTSIEVCNRALKQAELARQKRAEVR